MHLRRLAGLGELAADSRGGTVPIALRCRALELTGFSFFLAGAGAGSSACVACKKEGPYLYCTVLYNYCRSCRNSMSYKLLL